MKKVLSLFICFSLLASPLQALASIREDASTSSTTVSTELEAAPVPKEVKLEEATVNEDSPLETELPSAEVPSDELQEVADNMGEFKETLFNRQRIKTLVSHKAETVLATQEMLTLAGLIDEIIYELAILLELEYEDIEITDEEYFSLGHDILVSYYQYADYLIATHKEIYTEGSLAALKASVVAARQHLNSNDVTFNSMESHFYQLQNQVMLLEKVPDFTLDTSALTRLLAEISAAKLNKKEYVLSIYTIFEELHSQAKEIMVAINQGEVLPQSEVDKLTKQLELAYTSLVKKEANSTIPMEAINLTLTNTSVKYPILAEGANQEIMARVYGDNGFFQEDGMNRVALYIAGHPIYEDFILNDDGLNLSMNQINSLILEAKLEAIGAGVTIPNLPLVTRNYQINIEDQRSIPTEVVVIPEQADYSKNITLTGGNFGQTHLIYNYEGEFELITLDYYLSKPDTESQSLESTQLGFDEPVLVSVQIDGKEQLIRLVFEKEVKDGKPKPSIKDPDDQKDKNKDTNDTQNNKQTDKNKNKQNTNQPKNKKLPKTNELNKNQFMFQIIGTSLIAFAFYNRFKYHHSLRKLEP